MNTEKIVTVLTSLAVVISGVLLANMIERKYLSSKVDLPQTA